MNHSELSEQFSELEQSVVEIDEVNAEQSVDDLKQTLTSQFLIRGMIGVAVGSIVVSLLMYLYLQSSQLDYLSKTVHADISLVAKNVSARKEFSRQQAYENTARITKSRIMSSQALKVFDAQGKFVQRVGPSELIPNSVAFSDLNVLVPYQRLSPNTFSASMFLSLLTGSYPPVVLVSLIPLQKKRAFVVISVDHSDTFSSNRAFALLLFLGLMLSSSLIFVLLRPVFLRSVKTVDEQEHRLNEQISRLSNLLNINKSMQRSIRTASARAVELNEQFLRRTGADLHDGPAQMIGFSVMRLKQAIQKDESNLISPEFHAINQALEESLEEIRGISSGLVLPQLETMSLEECMKKVVLLHTATHPTEVEEVYGDIEHEIPLPIKICAYRLVQEGLNNSFRHGEAEKCRLKVSITNNILQIVLKDNGVGFRKSKLTNDGKHLGLIGLKDRIESLGGKLSINSELGTGTTLQLVISLDEKF